MTVVFTVPMNHFPSIIKLYLYHPTKKWNIITNRVEGEFNVSGKEDIFF